MPVSGADHGFYGDDHARLEPGAVAGGAEVGHLGSFVELAAHAVAHEIPDHTEAEGLHILLDPVAHIGDTAAHPGVFDPLEEALTGDVDELPGLLAHLSTGEGGGTVAVKAIQIGAHVDGDDVALLQLSAAGQAVNDHFVHRDTGRTRKAVKPQKGGLGAVAFDEAADRSVDLVGGDPGADHGAGQGPGRGGEPSGPAHSLNLPLGFQ